MPQQGEQQRLSAWAGFAPKLAQWLEVIEGRGPAVVQQAYLDTLNGRVPPERGLQRIGGISSRSFCAIPNGYRVREQGKRRKDGK